MEILVIFPTLKQYTFLGFHTKSLLRSLEFDTNTCLAISFANKKQVSIACHLLDGYNYKQGVLFPWLVGK